MAGEMPRGRGIDAMKKTYITTMPNHIGAFLKASECFLITAAAPTKRPGWFCKNGRGLSGLHIEYENRHIITASRL